MFTPRKSLTITLAAMGVVVAAGAVWVATRPGAPYMPHGHCFLWEPGLLWTHVTSDLLIGMAYVSISVTLAYIVAKARRNLPFHSVVLLFGLFIIACGSTHFMEAWTIWHPDYWLSAMIKVVTAVASVATAILLPPLVPSILSLLAASRLQSKQKEELEAEMKQRMVAEADLLKMKENLEQHVRERTSKLSQANTALTLYENIFNKSAWGVAIVDSLRGLIHLANPAFARMHGYNPGEMMGMPVSQTFAPESAPRIPDLLDIINARDHLMYHSVHIRKDGSRFDCLTDVTLVRDPEGLPLFRFGYFQDVTNQKRAEEDIRSVVTSAPCILWRAVVQGEQGWQTYEPGVRKFKWDLKVQDEPGAQHFLPLTVPQDGTYSRVWVESRYEEDARAMDETAAKALINGDASYSQQFRVCDKSGTTIWIREEVAIVKLGPGKWQCTGVCMDATEEHRLSDQLRQQAELLELAHDAIIVRDCEGEILYWNKGAEDLYGWRRDDVIGKFINDILTARKPPEESYGILGERGYWAGRVYHRTKDGREIAVDSRHLLVPRADGTKVILEANHEIMTALPAEIT